MIIEKIVKAKELPEVLRADADLESFVVVSVRSLTENGFTEEFEQGVLAAEKEAALSPLLSIEDFIKEMKSQKP